MDTADGENRPMAERVSARIDAFPTRKIRVAHVTHGLDVGGQEKLLVEFARHADRTGFELSFVSLGGRGVLAPALEACHWPVVCLEQPSGLRPSLLWRMVRYLRKARIDVVHTHGARALLYGALAGRVARTRRTIHTRHGRDIELSRRQLFVFRQAARCVDRFVCVSRDAEQLSHEQGIAEKKLCTILNGVDLNRFDGSGPMENGPLITVARLSPEKGHDTLLRAVAIAARRVPDLRLHIAGDGPCRPELQRQAQQLGVDGNVRFLGQVTDVAELLRGGRGFVLASYSEGIPLTLLEAMAAGLPSIVTSVGGMPEVVDSGRTGWLTPPRDASALAEAITQLWSDPKQARQRGLAGRDFVRQRFSVSKMVRMYERLYDPQRIARMEE